jgi:DnaJ like chaperone protein
MSIWDKLAAATAELAVGGPIGALLGGVAGHHAKDQNQNGHAKNEVPFTVGVIALGAKMAKADGVITKDEVRAFKGAFKVSDAEMKHAAHVFNLAKQDVAGYEACAEQLVTIFKGNRKLLEDVLEGLFHIAKPTRSCIQARSSSWRMSPSASASPTPNSATSRRATSSPPNVILTTCWASNRPSAMRS